jgi:hypothetical protein
LDPAVYRHTDTLVTRCDAPVPRSTALIVRELWLEALRGMQRYEGDALLLHGSTEIFFARDDNGRPLAGVLPRDPGPKTKQLLEVAMLLLAYCDAPGSARSRLSVQIEQEAIRLLSHIRGE